MKLLLAALLAAALGLFPDRLADESGEVPTISGFALEGITGGAAFAVGGKFGDLGLDFAFGLHVVELIIHFSSPLVKGWLKCIYSKYTQKNEIIKQKTGILAKKKDFFRI